MSAESMELADISQQLRQLDQSARWLADEQRTANLIAAYAAAVVPLGAPATRVEREINERLGLITK